MDPNINGKKLAYPLNMEGMKYHMGLSKREQFAAMAMQGLIAQSPTALSAAEFARQAVVCADALLAELAK
jgi:hypothetical protein